MKRIILFIVFICLHNSYGQTNTENYIQTTAYNKEFYGDYINFTQSIRTNDLLFNGAGGASGTVTITNNSLVTSFGGSWASSNRLKIGVIKVLNTNPVLPNLELGDILSGGNPNGYKLKIEEGKLIMYSRYFLDGISTNISKNIPGGSTIDFTTSIGTIHSCPSSGGGGSSGSLSINNGKISLIFSGGWSETCELQLGQIKYLSTSTIPNIELGHLTSNLGIETAYKAKIENNWLVFYTDETIPAYPTGGSINKTVDLNISDDHKIKNLIYYDGLGRTKQSISVDAGGQKQNIIKHYEYDSIGRQIKKYLPFASNETNLNVLSNPLSELQTFYATEKYENTTNPYSQSQIEASPLNRIIKEAAPGETWKLGHGREMEFDYQTNDLQEVRQFEVNFINDNLSEPELIVNTNNYYTPGDLYKTIIRDENHSGTSKNHTKEEFKDKLGRVILKRAYADTDLNQDGNIEIEVQHDTYYVYDIYNNLTFVIPPKVNIQDGISSSELSELCYQYKYDGRNRLIEKKIPGKGWEYIVYNKLDQPIMTQDANLKTKNQWLFTVYDAFGRIAYTGIDENNTTNRSALQLSADAATKQYVTRTDTPNNYAGTTVYYSKNAYPTSFDKLYTINYYDNYDVGNVVSFNPANGAGTWEGMTPVPNVKGLPTVAQIRVLETDQWITTSTYYDDQGRPWETHIKNEHLDTEDWILNKLDFSGNVLKTRSRHQKGTNPVIVTIDTFTYDNMNRLLSHRQCIGDDSLSNNCGGLDPSLSENLVLSEIVTNTAYETAINNITLSPGFKVIASTEVTFSASIEQPGGEIIVSNTYDELGVLDSKKVGNLQQVDYKYNVRGWLKHINNPASLGSDLFAFTINYDTTTENLNATPLYNGNISETIWKTASDNAKRSYGYKYDALNRITTGLDSTTDRRYSLNTIEYDKNGNISNLVRNGHTNNTATSFGIMDNLVYTYEPNSNKLLKINDSGNDLYGFKDSLTDQNDYQYDDNGNMIKDNNKNITEISYNHLNLPTRITFQSFGIEPEKYINYTYDAAGIKLKKEVQEVVILDNSGVVPTYGTNTIVTEYSGNYIYKGNQTNGAGSNSFRLLTNNIATSLEFMNHPEGYIERDNVGKYNYIYQYRDHLDNIRLSYADDNKDGIINPATEIRKENNYYPFGLTHKGYNSSISQQKNNYKQFQGQEFTEDLELNIHEWKYRISDPATGRFWQIDPLAESYVYNGTYNFAENTVIWAKELEGLESWYTTTNSTNPYDHFLFASQSGPLTSEYALSQGYTQYSNSYEDITVKDYNFTDTEIQALSDWNNQNGSSINGACLACATRGSEILTGTDVGWNYGTGLNLNGRSVYDLGQVLVDNNSATQLNTNQGSESNTISESISNTNITDNAAFLGGLSGGWHSIIVTFNTQGNNYSIFDQGTGWDGTGLNISSLQGTFDDINTSASDYTFGKSDKWGARLWALYKNVIQTIPAKEPISNLSDYSPSGTFEADDVND